MCEEFSEYSSIKQIHLDQGLPKKRRMYFELIEKVVNSAKNLGNLKEIIPSTMGEPLLYKDFDKIIKLCQNNDLKLNLTTNGTFPIKTAKEWAKIIVPITSDIKISFNGAKKETQEKIMKKTNYENHLQNIMDFIEIRDQIYKKGGNYCRVTLQVTFLESNYQEFPDMVMLASELGVDRIKGHHLWDHFSQIKKESLKRNSDSIQRWNKIVEEMELKRDLFPLKNGNKIILDNIYKLNYNKKELYEEKDCVCPFLGNEVWVAWNGQFNPCCAPDEERKTLGKFNNLENTPLDKIWMSDEYQNLKENYLEKPLCQKCNMRRPKKDVKKWYGKI